MLMGGNGQFIYPQNPSNQHFSLNKLTLNMSCLARAIAYIDWTPWGDQMMFFDILKSTVMMRNLLPPYDPSKLPSVDNCTSSKGACNGNVPGPWQDH